MGRRFSELSVITDVGDDVLLSGVDPDDTSYSVDGTNKIFSKANLLKEEIDAIESGWIDPNETWAYASATTITVPSGAASRYQKGMPFKLTANSVVLEGYIVGIADTVLTVAGDALTNHAFTANYYGQSGTVPLGFQEWFNWTPTFQGFSTDPIGIHQFKITGQTVTAVVRHTTTGVSNGNTFRFSTPVTAIEGGAESAHARDNNTRISAFFSAGSDIDSGLLFYGYRNTSSTGWTTTGNKELVRMIISYSY